MSSENDNFVHNELIVGDLRGVQKEDGGEDDNKDDNENVKHREAGEAVGYRGVAKPRTQRNTNNAAMLDVAGGPSKSPPRLITDKMRLDVPQKEDGPTKVVLGDGLGGAMTLGSSLNNYNTLPFSSSSFFSALNADTTYNFDVV